MIVYEAVLSGESKSEDGAHKMYFATLFLLLATLVKAQTAEPLKLEKTVELPEVQGRIDHMSIDVKGQRLFVSALGNNTVEVIDLKAGKPTNTISGLREPQGTLYVPASDRLFVASGKDGTVQMFNGSSLQLLKTIEYGDDADNLRYDGVRQRIYVGFGGGALGEIDSEGQKIAEAKFGAHPESFQLEKTSSRIYVNLPGSRKIAVVDREAHTVLADLGYGLGPWKLCDGARRNGSSSVRCLACSGALGGRGYDNWEGRGKASRGRRLR